MTGEKTENEENDLPVNTDPLLEQLVVMANEQGIGFGVTLCVGGALISGNIISVKEYMSYVGDVIHEAYTKGGNSEAGEAFKEGLDEASKSDDEADGERGGPYDFIHISGARVMHPGGPPIPPFHMPGTVWRVRLDAVDGFLFGVVSDQTSN